MKNYIAKFESRDWITILLTIIIAFIVLFINEKYLITFSVLSKVVESLTVSFVIVFILSIITNRFFFDEIIQRVVGTLKMSLNASRLGLSDIHSSYSDSKINYSELITSSTKNIDILSIYSSTWLNSHITELKNFLETNLDAKMRFIFLDDNCETKKSLEFKFNIGASTNTNLSQKICESITTIKNGLKSITNYQNRIEIYTQQFPYSYSLFRFDDTAVIIPYKHSPGRSTEVPAFVFRKAEIRNLYDYYLSDLEELLEQETTKKKDLSE